MEVQLQSEIKKSFNWAEVYNCVVIFFFIVLIFLFTKYVYHKFLACVSVATTNLHTGFALGFSAIIIPQLNDTNVNNTEINSNEMGLLNESQLSWIGKHKH